VSIVLTTLAALLACGLGAPPLQVRNDGRCAIIDLTWLGEYGTEVSRITIKSKDGARLWDAHTNGPDALIGSLKVCIGRNDVRPPMWGETHKLIFEAVNGEFFDLEARNTYRVEVISPNYSRIGAREFRIESDQ